MKIYINQHSGWCDGLEVQELNSLTFEISSLVYIWFYNGLCVYLRFLSSTWICISLCGYIDKEELHTDD